MGKGKRRVVGQTSAHLSHCLFPHSLTSGICRGRVWQKEAWTKKRSAHTGAGMPGECEAWVTLRVGTDTPQEWRQVRAAVGVCKL